MGGRVVILVVSMILVVGLGTSEVKALGNRKLLSNVHSDAQVEGSAHVHGHAHGHAHHGHHTRAHAHVKAGADIGVGLNPPSTNNGDSLKTVNELCASATYKDSCIRTLSTLTTTCGTSPQEYFRNGLKLALDETTKVSNLPNTLVRPQASTESRASSALETCSHLFEQATDRLKMALDQVNSGDINKILKDPTTIFNVRLELTDVNTFSTSCLDEFQEAQSPELQKLMQGGIDQTKELAVNMLDIISTYSF